MPRRRKPKETDTYIDNCEERFRFRCPKLWSELAVTQDSAVRYCGVCEKNVYYCQGWELAERLAAEGKCIALHVGDVPVVGNMISGEDYEG